MIQRFRIIILFTLFIAAELHAQKQSLIDSLNLELPRAKTDKQKALIMNDLSYAYSQNELNLSKSIEYAENALTLAKKNSWKDVASKSLNILGNNYQRKKNYSQALEYYLQALKIYEDLGSKKNVAAITSNIGLLYYKSNNLNKAIEYYSRALKLNEETGNKKSMVVVVSNIAKAYYDLKDYDNAKEYYDRALRLNEELDNKQEAAKISTDLGNLFKNQDLSKSLEYYQKSLKINESIGNKKEAAFISNSIGSLYFNQDNFQKAIEYYSKSQKLYEDVGNVDGESRNIGNIGVTYFRMVKENSLSESEQQKFLQQATDKLSDAIRKLDENNSSNDAKQQFEQTLASVQSYASQTGKNITTSKRSKKDTIFSTKEAKGRDYVQQADLKNEYNRKQDSIKLESRNKELNLRKEMELQQLEFEYQRKQALAKTDEERQRLKEEEAQKRLQIENDYKSLFKAVQIEQQLVQAKQEKENAIAQAEIKRQKNIKNGFIAGGIMLLLLAFVIYRSYRNQKKSFKLISEANKIILCEKQRSEELLLNILPVEVAEELKNNGKTQARLYNEVTVLFTDFVNFTQTVENLTPQQLVNELHECFSVFDDIIERNGLEKIKTIGDAYMAVSGLPEATPDHAINAAKAAVEIRDFMEERKKHNKVFEARIGINSGQVVAGIVGVKKFAYDIWGDAVNTAARMEQSGVSGKINVSSSTYELIKNDFDCTYRGRINAKNKGDIDMYFINNPIE